MEYIEIFEDERAFKYDRFTQTWIVNYPFVIDTVPKIIEMENPNAKEILIVGCGTGNEMLGLANAKNKAWNITGIDPSPDMIKIANEKLKYHSKVKIIKGKVSQLPINKKYDAATLLLVLHFMKDDGTKQALLQSISDRLQKGATFILLDIFGNQTEFYDNLKLLGKLLPKQVESISISDKIASITERVHPISEDRLSEILNKTGFSKPIRFFQSAIYGGWVVKKI